MNNFSFLNLINPQIARAKSVGHDELTDKYFVEIPAFVGYDNSLACSVYIEITEKLLEDYDGNELYEWIRTLPHHLMHILTGTDGFVPGKDYWISDSLYQYILYYADEDDNSSSADSSNSSFADSSESSEEQSSSTSSEASSSSVSEDSSSSSSPLYPINGILIIEGPDILKTLNTTGRSEAWLKKVRAERVVEAATQNPEIEVDEEVSSSSVDSLSSQTIEELSQKLYNECVLPDYVWYYSDNTVAQNTKNWYDLTGTNNKDMANLAFFYGRNSLLTYTFTEDELNNIPSTFFKIILKYAVAQNYYTNTNNQIYNLVMKYWANSGTDDIYTGISLILGSLYTTSDSTTTTCGCSSDSSTTLDTETCAERYQAAMKQYLIDMLGDDQYYYDWFFIPSDGQCPIPNDVMIDLLIELLTEFLSLGYDLSFSSNTAHCGCPEVSTDDGACNRATIQNYIKVLNWVKNNEIDAHTNKIKVYGNQFGTLLPKLVF